MPPGSPFGPGIVTLVTYFHGCQMVGYAHLAEMLEDLFGLKTSQGAIANILSRAAEPLAERAQTIHETVRNSRVIASDETSARVKGTTFWQWTFATSTAVAHLIAPTRGKIVPLEFLDGARPKVWLSDRLLSQCNHAEAHQMRSEGEGTERPGGGSHKRARVPSVCSAGARVGSHLRKAGMASREAWSNTERPRRGAGIGSHEGEFTSPINSSLGRDDMGSPVSLPRNDTLGRPSPSLRTMSNDNG
jgi:hypothetical protein